MIDIGPFHMKLNCVLYNIKDILDCDINDFGKYRKRSLIFAAIRFTFRAAAMEWAIGILYEGKNRNYITNYVSF